MNTHPNTRIVLDAWRRLADGGVNEPVSGDNDDPGLVSRLFVLSHVNDGDFPFQRVGYALERLFGRSLAEHNFLSLWNEPDRRLIQAALAAAATENGPSIVRARGETLTGRQVEIEVSLAPLSGAKGSLRYLGLCQTLTPEDVLGGRPLRRLQAVAVYPPATPPGEPTIRIVSSR
jgi:hypothetical protein